MEEELKKRGKIDKKTIIKKVKPNFLQKDLLLEALDTEVIIYLYINIYLISFYLYIFLLLKELNYKWLVSRKFLYDDENENKQNESHGKSNKDFIRIYQKKGSENLVIFSNTDIIPSILKQQYHNLPSVKEQLVSLLFYLILSHTFPLLLNLSIIALLPYFLFLFLSLFYYQFAISFIYLY